MNGNSILGCVEIDINKSMFDFIESINDFVHQKLKQEAKKVPSFQLNLDPRAGPLLVGPNYIAVDLSNAIMLDYYCGFKYVDSNAVRVVGDWKIYFDSDGRVQEVLESFETDE